MRKLICRIFGHKWKRVEQSNSSREHIPFDRQKETIKCRCGMEKTMSVATLARAMTKDFAKALGV